MLAIERANAPKFDGIRTAEIDFKLPQSKLVELVNHFARRAFDSAHVPPDLFGDAYEYLIRTFASKAGKSSGELYTPCEVSFLMSEIVEPDEQHEICDWASGSGSLLLQCREYVRRRGKDANRLFLFAQVSVNEYIGFCCRFHFLELVYFSFAFRSVPRFKAIWRGQTVPRSTSGGGRWCGCPPPAAPLPAGLLARLQPVEAAAGEFRTQYANLQPFGGGLLALHGWKCQPLR